MAPEPDQIVKVDDETAARLHRLEAMGVTLQGTIPEDDEPQVLQLVDIRGHVLIECVVRLDMEDQVREMLEFYEIGIFGRGVTRH